MLYFITSFSLVLQICGGRTVTITKDHVLEEQQKYISSRTIEAKEPGGGGGGGIFGNSGGYQQPQAVGVDNGDVQGWMNERKGWFGYRAGTGGGNYGNNQMPNAPGGMQMNNNQNFFQRQKQKFVGKKTQEALGAVGIQGPMAVGAQGLVQQTMGQAPYGNPYGNAYGMGPRPGLIEFFFAPFFSILEFSGFRPRQQYIPQQG